MKLAWFTVMCALPFVLIMLLGEGMTFSNVQIAIFAVPVVLVAVKLAGFGAIGIAAGSLGALMMRASTTWWGGLLGPLVAILQSIGAKASFGAASFVAWAAGAGALSYLGVQKLTASPSSGDVASPNGSDESPDDASNENKKGTPTS